MHECYKKSRLMLYNSDSQLFHVCDPEKGIIRKWIDMLWMKIAKLKQYAIYERNEYHWKLCINKQQWHSCRGGRVATCYIFCSLFLLFNCMPWWKNELSISTNKKDKGRAESICVFRIEIFRDKT